MKQPNLISGVLSTAGNFDYELVREYVLNIEAQDAGDPPLSDTCMVTVTVTDANDNKPTFSQLTYTANVREDSKVEDQIIQVCWQMRWLCIGQQTLEASKASFAYFALSINCSCIGNYYFGF